MTLELWFLAIGGLLLLVGLAAGALRRLPLTSAMVYLAVGLLLGPSGLQLFHFNPLEQSGLLEVITEVAVLISLFAAGLKMPVPVRWRVWQTPLRLAFVAMALTVLFVGLFGVYALGLPLGVAVLLGAILAPTDPVLATEIQIREPGDEDSLRLTLTTEAGLNDGSAFPFVMLGLGLLELHSLGPAFSGWFLRDLLWATLGAMLLGAGAGWLTARIARAFSARFPLHGVQHDFVGLGLIGCVYGLCGLVSAWGFLGVFVAAVALRQTEVRQAPAQLDSDTDPDPDPDRATAGDRPLSVSQESLVFKEHLERLSEVVLVVLIGGTLFLDSWSLKALGLAAFVMLVARPLAVFIALAGAGQRLRLKLLCAWFGVRGIGSLYYLMFAVEHGLTDSDSLQLIHYTLVVVCISILIHGISVKPALKKFW